MIAKMRKVSVVVYYKAKEDFLARLQELGVVHIIEREETAGAEQTAGLQAAVNRVQKCIRTLEEAGKGMALPAPAEHPDPAKLLDVVETWAARRDAVKQRLTQLEKQRLFLDPWGDFNPRQLEQLKRAGLTARFFICANARFAELDLSAAAYSAVISRSDRETCFVALEKGVSLQLDCTEVFLPKRNSAYVALAQTANRKLDVRTMARLGELRKHLQVLRREEAQARNRLAYTRSLQTMTAAAAGAVHVLQGWVPVAQQPGLEEFLRQQQAASLFEEPTREDSIPILLKNKKVFKLFEPITRIFSLPDYYELDTTPFLAPFFALFVGLCMADVAYGAIILIAATIANWKLSAENKPFAKLLMVLGSAIIIGGLLLNSFFSHTLFGGPGIPEGSAYISHGAQYFSPLCSVETAKGPSFPMMSFAIFIGIVQVLLGIGLRAYNAWRNDGFAAALQPVSNAFIFIGMLVWIDHANFLNIGLYRLAVGAAPVGQWLLAVPLIVGQALTIGGALLLCLFNTPGSRLPMRVSVLFFWEVYNLAAGLLGNILSYLRLFALGLAGGLLGAAFNYIAFMFITDKQQQIHYDSFLVVLTILVLIVGHSLNLALSMIGSFVHPLRLTFVEFYGNEGFKGGGKQYAPFIRLK